MRRDVSATADYMKATSCSDSPLVVLGSLSDNGTDDLTDGQGQLPTRDNRTTNSGRRDLGQVHGDTVGNDTDTDTEDESSNDQEGDRSNDDQLKDTSDSDDEDGTPEGTLSAEVVSQDGSSKGSNKLSCLDDRGEDSGVGGSDLILEFTGFFVGSEFTKVSFEPVHLQHSGEVGTIVTVQEGTEYEDL